MNQKLLEDIGLTKGEITVYLTLLKLGETTTGKIIKQAQISSGKIYEILDKLIQKGLVSFILKDKTKYFSACSPQRIVDYVDEKERKLHEEKEQLQKELPYLLSLQKEGIKSSETRLFKGFKGFKTAIYEALDQLTSKDEVIGMGILSTKGKQYNRMWQHWHKERIKRKIRCRVLFSDRKTNYYQLFTKMKFTQVKVLQGITPAAIDVMGDRALILTHGKEPSVLVIDNKEIAQSFTTFFESLWGNAKD